MFKRIRAILCITFFAFTVLGGIACAAKNVTIAFTQSVEDCVSVAQWDLYAAAVAAGDPTIAEAVLIGLITAPTGICGVETLSQEVSTGLAAGNTRFWLRTVATNGAESAFSNAVDAEVPLNAPVILEILFR